MLLCMNSELQEPLPTTDRQGRHDGVLLLSVTQVVGLCLGAFALGVVIPNLLFVSSPSARLRTANHPRGGFVSQGDLVAVINNHQNESFNNLLASSTTTRTADEELAPKIAWLMSFPNSGTSYTLDLVETVSNMSTATNYGPEQNRKGLDENGFNSTTLLPVFSRGPYWRSPLKQYPESVVLTKTHCGGYCHDCPASTWIETPHSFLAHCATSDDRNATGTINTTSGVRVRLPAARHVYDYKEVTRAIHLIRDPLDNMVARYHLEVTRVTENNQTDLMKRYTYDEKGFANLCADAAIDRQGYKDSHVDPKVVKLLETIPCYLDLFRYVQWHNLAFLTTDEALNLPTHILYYEDYSSDFEGTLQSLLDFLDLPNMGHHLPFQPGKSYHSYFSDDQISRIREAVMMLALPITWKHLERYF